MNFTAPHEEICASGDKSGNQKTEKLASAFALDIHNILCHTEDADGKEICVLELGSLVTRSIIDAIDKVRDNSENKSLWIAEYGSSIIMDTKGDNPEMVYKTYAKRIDNFCNNAISSGKVPILGFSFIGAYGLLPRFSEIIKEMKAKHDGLVCVIGGSDFRSLPDKHFLDKIFAYGMDIVNIGGASEFVDFFGKLSGDDIFYRDAGGFLRIKTEREIPNNLIFEHQKNDISDIKPGNDIETTSYYSNLNKALYFSIKNNPCLNNCGYCASYLHKPTPLLDTDLNDSIDDCNRYLSSIDDTDISLRFDNPNPMQYIDKFTRFLMSLDLSKNKNVHFFGDFMGMGNEIIYEKTISLIEGLLAKWPNLDISIRFGIDAMHFKDDGEFLGRTVGNKVAQEDRYEISFKKLKDFYKRYPKGGRVESVFNLVLHPNMQLDDYLERIDFATQYKDVPMGSFPLVAHFNTKIERDHKGFYMPEYETADIQLLDFNTWGHFYLNSRYLDCYVFLKNSGHAFLFPSFVGHFRQLDEKDDSRIFSYFMDWHYSGIMEVVKEYKSILFNFKRKKRKMYKEELDKIFDNTLKYLDFMTYRENYIIKINPEYKTIKSVKLMQEIEKHKKEFLKLKEITK